MQKRPVGDRRDAGGHVGERVAEVLRRREGPFVAGLAAGGPGRAWTVRCRPRRRPGHRSERVTSGPCRGPAGRSPRPAGRRRGQPPPRWPRALRSRARQVRARAEARSRAAPGPARRRSGAGRRRRRASRAVRGTRPSVAGAHRRRAGLPAARLLSSRPDAPRGLGRGRRPVRRRPPPPACAARANRPGGAPSSDRGRSRARPGPRSSAKCSRTTSSSVSLTEDRRADAFRSM